MNLTSTKDVVVEVSNAMVKVEMKINHAPIIPTPPTMTLVHVRTLIVQRRLIQRVALLVASTCPSSS